MKMSICRFKFGHRDEPPPLHHIVAQHQWGSGCPIIIREKAKTA